MVLEAGPATLVKAAFKAAQESNRNVMIYALEKKTQMLL